MAEKQLLVAAHRGSSGGNIMENTPNSTAAALLQGADIIEMDVARDLDGNYFCMHDGMEFRLFASPDRAVTEMTGEETAKIIYKNSNRVDCGRPATLDDMLEDAKSRSCLLNIDRSWRYWDKIFPVFQKHDMTDQLLFKSPADDQSLAWFKANAGDAMYMPMIWSTEDLDKAKAAGVNLVGAEILFSADDAPQASEAFLARMKEDRLFCWVNAITLGQGFNISAGHGDDSAILDGDMDGNWGWMVRRGFNVIQTDWPALLKTYLRKTFDLPRKSGSPV